MFDLLPQNQTALVVTLIVIPAVAAFLTERIGKIRTVVDAVFNRLAFADKFVEKALYIRAAAKAMSEKADTMLENGNIDEAEVKQLSEWAKEIYSKVKPD